MHEGINYAWSVIVIDEYLGDRSYF